jgi:hypothetical protein
MIAEEKLKKNPPVVYQLPEKVFFFLNIPLHQSII